MTKRPNSSTEDDEGQRKRHHGEASSRPLPIPDLSTTTPWSSSDISSELPPLPRILDPELELAVFSHPGIGHGPNYERLEWLGDAYIEMIATALIFQTFGFASAGRNSQIREQLVRNVTLAKYFMQYKMDKRARLPSDMGTMEEMMRMRSKQKELTKIQGDIFEAYVAAVVVSDPVNGITAAITWLKSLWARTIKDQIKQAEKFRQSAHSAQGLQSTAHGGTSVSNALHKERLAQILVVKGILLRYEDVPSKDKKDKDTGLPLFTVGVYLDGWGESNKFLGVGTAIQKKEAGQNAAAMALENKKLMSLYGDKKKAFLAAQKALNEAKESKASA
ncbi:ribonuclease III domain-containing protein [Dactylonectria estremocensis]|uniref:Ribonuclease III domain-containing protein n=1 Tax=Dactylonectria estremocensis TaxID=1079267 RepID=A0A9P9F6H4_9HYPO|nr:ribonuclease III domain-containing protein [Dactylonectria estremocensis]